MPHSTLHPLRFEPFLRPMPWGGRRIGRFLGKNLPTGQTYGESWEVSDHPLHDSCLATATDFGRSLRQLMTEDRAVLLGTAAERHAVFPWLIKLLDVQDWLSVQVHPDEAAVRKLLPGEFAKTEAWFILDAEEGSRIYAGLKPGVGPKELRRALEHGAVVDCLHGFSPKPGDFVFLPAGTVHAVGGGVLLAEVQQTSDATFRLYDWNRRDSLGNARPLHLDEALASIHWGQSPVEPIASSAGARQRLVACPYFEIERVAWSSAISVGGLGQLQALVITDGQGRFANGEFCMPGDVWILPAAMPAMTLQAERCISGLVCSLP